MPRADQLDAAMRLFRYLRPLYYTQPDCHTYQVSKEFSFVGINNFYVAHLTPLPPLRNGEGERLLHRYTRRFPLPASGRGTGG